MAEQYLKDPDAVIDYAIDWSVGYLMLGELIMASGWSILPQGAVNDLIIDHIGPTVSGVTTAFVRGGTVGRIYQLTNRITTSQGRTDDSSLTIRVEEK